MILSSHIFKSTDIPKVRADFSFFLFMSLLFLLRESCEVWGIIMVCLLHESGHLIMISLFGIRIKEIRLSGYGINIITSKNAADSDWKNVIVLLSGPAVNILLFFLLRNSFHDTAVLSLSAGIYNLLPYSRLDGGAAIDTLILGNIHEKTINAVLTFIRISLIAVSASMVYVYGIRVFPVMAAFVVLYLSQHGLHRV